MLPFRLARIAIEAEGLRLGRKVRRTVIRVALACIACGLLLVALGFLHVAAWYWLRQSHPGETVALMFAGADVVLALILGAIAGWSRPGRVEREALVVRRNALEDAAGAVTFSALLMQMIDRMFLSRRAR